jgi:site-specific DNA-cytosine methylase
MSGDGVSNALRTGHEAYISLGSGGPDDNDGQAGRLVYRKAQKAHDRDDAERWEEADALALNGQGSGDGGASVIVGAEVRRLTPVECCRLQGFPDDWLGEPNEPPDSPRYAAMGDAVTVNVAEWLGTRLLDGYAPMVQT